MSLPENAAIPKGVRRESGKQEHVRLFNDRIERLTLTPFPLFLLVRPNGDAAFLGFIVCDVLHDITRLASYRAPICRPVLTAIKRQHSCSDEGNDAPSPIVRNRIFDTLAEKERRH